MARSVPVQMEKTMTRGGGSPANCGLRCASVWACPQLVIENALIDENPAAGIKGLYAAGANNRAQIIVEPKELEAILKHTSRLASLAFVSQRRQDFVAAI